MPDLIKIQCPECKSIHSVADSYLYQKVRCSKCNSKFVVYDDITPPKPVSTPIEKLIIPGQLNKETWIVLVSLLCIGIAVFLYNNPIFKIQKHVLSESQKQPIRDAMREAALLDGILATSVDSTIQEKQLQAALSALDEIKTLPDKNHPNSDMTITITGLQIIGSRLCGDASSMRFYNSRSEYSDHNEWKKAFDSFNKYYDEFHARCLSILQD